MDIARHGDKARKILPPLLVVVLVIISAVAFRIENQKSIISNSAVIMGDMSEQCSVNLNSLFISNSSAIKTFAGLFPDRLLDDDLERRDALREIEDIEIFNYVRFIDKDGLNHSSSGKEVDVKDRTYYL
ncbi:MAG: hypothetical protein KBS81_06615, partial [Spirochaetales bacterium]|nr:hypothetical protein [Candidatus Physcosoma equi]